jgi:hypothetical protein
MSCLTCPENPNLADVALQLQYTALQAEQCIYTQEQLLRSAVNRPTIITTTTATFNVSSGVETSLVDVGTPVVTFNNSTIAPPGTAWRNFFLQGGIFLCGVTYNVTAAAPTDNTLRRTALGLRNTYDPSPQYSQSLVFTQYETTAALGVDVSVMGVFAATPNRTYGNATLLQNNGSSVTVSTGLVLWATRLGDTTATRTV